MGVGQAFVRGLESYVIFANWEYNVCYIPRAGLNRVWYALRLGKTTPSMQQSMNFKVTHRRLLFPLVLLAVGLFRLPALGANSQPAGVPGGGSSTNLLLPGTRFATPWYICDSGVAGPTIMIVGGVHGNEPAGANAAEAIRHWQITKGKLVVVPRANVPGLAANKRNIPNLSTNLSNLNRNYPRAGHDEDPRGEPATAIWDIASQFKPDWLLDLHEGFDFHQVNDKSVGSSVICFPNPKGLAATDLMLAAVNREITDDT